MISSTINVIFYTLELEIIKAQYMQFSSCSKRIVMFLVSGTLQLTLLKEVTLSHYEDKPYYHCLCISTCL